MNQGRANKISEVLKNVSTLGKQLKIPGSSGQPGLSGKLPEVKNIIGLPAEGTGFVRIIMYILAGILLIGIILLGVDQWITPVFQRSPGAPGYISIPGNDRTQVFWKELDDVADITIGYVAPPAGSRIKPLSVTNLVNQSSYSITMDVYIKNEYPQTLPTGTSQRVFFLLGTSLTNWTLQISLDNSKNTVSIICRQTATGTTGDQQALSIDNVPIHKPFRIGLVMSAYVMEGYLNGMLIHTKKLASSAIEPSSGNKIFATSNIATTAIPAVAAAPATAAVAATPAVAAIPSLILSSGIQVLNVRTFGYSASSAEMKARMSDLSTNLLFNPLPLTNG